MLIPYNNNHIKPFQFSLNYFNLFDFLSARSTIEKYIWPIEYEGKLFDLASERLYLLNRKARISKFICL